MVGGPWYLEYLRQWIRSRLLEGFETTPDGVEHSLHEFPGIHPNNITRRNLENRLVVAKPVALHVEHDVVQETVPIAFPELLCHGIRTQLRKDV
jgi:hypothetical protein